jgi:hypothetical protein
LRHIPLNIFSILLLIAFSQSISWGAAQAPQRDNRPRTALIGGQVTISGQPAANVTITIAETDSNGGGEFVSASGSTAKREPEIFTAVTDAGGRYRVAGLAAGNYKISASSMAYVLANQNSGAEPAKWVTLDGDDAKEDVNLSLARGGVITGRVTASDGRPLIATRVWLFSVIRNDDRTEYKSYNYQFQQMFETDDRGVYRIYGLPAGNYILSAGGAESYSSSKDPARNYRPTYFRGAASGSKAKIIEIKEGSEVTDVDIALGDLKKTYEASGRLLDAENETPIPQAYIWAIGFDRKSQEESGLSDSNRDMRRASAVTDSEGNFRLTDLTPGRYEVGCSGSGKREYHSDPASFEIVDDNVAGVEIKARRAATISGVAVIEGAVDPNLRRLLFTRDSIEVSVIYIDQYSQSTSGHSITEINPNGEFRVSVSRRGNEWKVYFAANQSKIKGLRVSRVELNGVEAPDGITVNPGQQITGVRVVFTQASGVIRGQVKVIGALPENAELGVEMTSGQEGAASSRAFRASRDGYSTGAVADGKGRFVFDALPPGEYAVRAYLRFRIDSHTTSSSNIGSPTQRVVVTNGRETPVELIIDLNKPGQEKQ